MRTGSCEDRVGPVHVLEPVAGRRHREQLRARLREEVARHLQPRALRERRGAHPAGDAADALARPASRSRSAGGERLRHLLGPMKFSPIWIGVATSRATLAQPAKSSARIGSSIQ